MRKHSMDIESVGGAIDVAVISKKDGFVCIKRKHYFDMAYNHHFLNKEKEKGYAKRDKGKRRGYSLNEIKAKYLPNRDIDYVIISKYRL